MVAYPDSSPDLAHMQASGFSSPAQHYLLQSQSHVHHQQQWSSRGVLVVPPARLATPIWVVCVVVDTADQSGMSYLMVAFYDKCCSLAQPGLPPVPAHAGGCCSLVQPS